jgi:hypothetical protein
MSDPPPPGPPPEPPDEAPWRSAPRPPRGGGSVWLGIVAGVLFFAVLTGLTFVLAPVLPWFSSSWFVLPIAYLVVAAVLMGRPATSRLGSGLLIAFGVSVLLGAGVCVALVSTHGLVA